MPTLLQKGFVSWINLVSSNPNWVTTILEIKVELDILKFWNDKLHTYFDVITFHLKPCFFLAYFQVFALLPKEYFLHSEKCKTNNDIKIKILLLRTLPWEI